MLAVDVSFLAVPGVNPNLVQSQPASQIITYLSTLCAMGSLIASLILANQIQVLHGENVDGAVSELWSIVIIWRVAGNTLLEHVRVFAWVGWFGLDTRPTLCSPYLGVRNYFDHLCSDSLMTDNRHRMIFFTIGLSTTMFHSTALVTLGVIGSVFAFMMLLTGWLVMAINNLHISSLIKPEEGDQV